MTREQRLATIFTELADTLVSDFDVVDFLDMLARRCVELLDVAATGIMLTDDSTLRVMAASDESAQLLGLLDRLARHGPCVDSLRSGARVVGTPLSSLAEVAADLTDYGVDVAVVDVLPMRLRDQTIGVVALLRGEPGPTTPESVALAEAMADVATIGLIQQRAIHEARLLAEQLRVALDSRVVLEQAKGALAERAGLDVAQAFDLMRGYARRRRRRLADVARDVLAGALGLGDLRGT